MILSRCYQNWKWPPEVHFKFFVFAKTQNLSRKLFKFYYHIPHDIRMCKWFLKVLPKFKMVAMDKLHIFVCAKPEKLKSVIIHILQSHYPQSVNVQVILLKFEMATTNRLFKYFWRQKLNLIYGGGWYIIGLPAYCSMFYWDSKWPPLIKFIFFCGRENLKWEILQSHSHDIEMCRCFFQGEIQNGRHGSTS